MLTKAEAIAKRELEPKWAKLLYDGLWFSPLRTRLRRVLRGDADARHRRGARLAPAGRRRRHRAPLRARALRRDARVVRHRRDVPARGVRGLHPDRRARGRARRRTRAEARARMTLWSGRVGTGVAPEVEELLRADDAELFFYDVEATRLHAAPGRGRGSSPTTSCARSERLLDGLTVGGRARGRAHRDRGAARRARAEDPRRPLAERPGRDRVSALRRRRLRGGDRDDRALRPRRSSTARRRRRRRRCPATRTSSARSR